MSLPGNVFPPFGARPFYVDGRAVVIGAVAAAVAAIINGAGFASAAEGVPLLAEVAGTPYTVLTQYQVPLSHIAVVRRWGGMVDELGYHRPVATNLPLAEIRLQFNGDATLVSPRLLGAKGDGESPFEACYVVEAGVAIQLGVRSVDETMWHVAEGFIEGWVIDSDRSSELQRALQRGCGG